MIAVRMMVVRTHMMMACAVRSFMGVAAALVGRRIQAVIRLVNMIVIVVFLPVTVRLVMEVPPGTFSLS